MLCIHVCMYAGIEIIKVPTWLLHGDKDTVVPPSVSLQLMQRYIYTQAPYTVHQPHPTNFHLVPVSRHTVYTCTIYSTCGVYTVDREIFVVKIFSYMIGTTKV